jgi:hypothetical protein
MPVCITQSFGLQAIRQRVPEWLAALRKGYAKAPRCGAPRRDGKTCTRLRMKGGAHCYLHLHGDARTTADLERGMKARRLLNSTNVRHRKEAESAVRNINRRLLQLHWKCQNPDVPGSTLDVPPADERRLRKHLMLKYDIDLHQFRHIGLFPERGLSPRAIDRLRWAAVLELTNRVSATSAGNRVRAAIRDDLAWFLKHGW